MTGEWRNRITAGLFGLVIGLIGGMAMLANETFDAHEDLAEFRQALNEARDTHRRLYARLSGMEQRVYRRMRELPGPEIDSMIEERPGDWRALVASILSRRAGGKGE